MLIQANVIYEILKKQGIQIRGAIHIGAHECEELGFYRGLGLKDTDVVWFEALSDKVAQMHARGIPNVYEAVMSDTVGEVVTFSRTNNDQSSSILELGTHAQHYPHITVIDKKEMVTTTLDLALAIHKHDPSAYNFWNLDIQGAELKALKGGEAALVHADVLYMEVNTEEVYKGCARMEDLDAYLEERGFTRVATYMVEQGWGDALYIRTSV